MYPTKEDKLKWWLGNLRRYDEELSSLESKIKTCIDGIASILREEKDHASEGQTSKVHTK